ncbi:MAG: chromate transporter [Muribaculaceae bacterium]|nr:chromate transporter [Muribaculaceae bacterium]
MIQSNLKNQASLPQGEAPESTNNNSLLQLFTSFFKIGCFTFGGGWAMISIIEREIVDKYHWIERKDFLDLLAVAQSLPGILAVNIATAVGDKIASKKGSLAAAAGTILPSFIIILMIAIFLTPDMIKNNKVISSIFMGIRPAVVALIIAPVITSAKAAKLTWKTIWIPLLVALMIYLDFGFISNPILYIILGGLFGFAIWKYSIAKLKNNEKKD